MENGKHTPGPWNVLQSGPATRFVVLPAPGLRHGPVCVTYGQESQLADAHLIAAAPELLSQLEFAVKLLSPLFGETAQIAAMRDTIAKARGQAHD